MLTKLLADLYIISLLDDEPNDVGGMSSAELKAKFDEAANTIKTYINESLIPELAGDTGAASVGISTVPGLTGISTVQAALAKIEEQMAEMTQGAVADESITTVKLAMLAVTTAKLADLCVTGGKIADGAVGSDKVALLAVLTKHLADKCVEESKIGDKAVAQRCIGDKVIGAQQLADKCVGSDQVDDLAIPERCLAAGAVSGAKIKAHAVSVDYTATLDTSWSGDAAPYTKEQTVDGITAEDRPLIDLVPSETLADAEEQGNAWALVYRAVTAENKITFYAKNKPAVSLPLQIRCIRK